MRLIDADALANYANNQIVGITANDIMRFPTIDAEPVKHGRWIKTSSPYHVKCSSCKTMVCIKFYGVKVEKFCRNCGAKMDGDTNNET